MCSPATTSRTRCTCPRYSTGLANDRTDRLRPAAALARDLGAGRRRAGGRRAGALARAARLAAALLRGLRAGGGGGGQHDAHRRQLVVGERALEQRDVARRGDGQAEARAHGVVVLVAALAVVER